MKSKGVLILLGVYVLLYIFTTIHAYMANRTLSTATDMGNEILNAEVLTAHLEYVAQAVAQMEIALGALIGALSATLMSLSKPDSGKKDE